MKSLILLTLMASAVMGQQYCQPGSFFKNDCNLCTCSLDGKSAACTDMQCNRDVYNSREMYCQPGKQFKIDECKTCTCSKDGSKALCTLEYCTPAMKKLPVAEYCTPNSIFSLDNCNTCKCSKDGSTAFCTLTNCPEDKPVISNLPTQVCKPHSQFSDYCNTCSCSADGMTFSCTRMMCDKNIWNQDGSMKVVAKSQKNQLCKPRTQFNDYCNVCTCNDDGTSFACTRMMCDKNIWNQDGSLKLVAKSQKKQVCKPRTQFNNYCNVCTCNEDGSSYACTRMMCDKDVWNQDGSIKVVDKSQKNQVCQPRTQFNNYCNVCTCNEDGSSYACTRMMCDKNVWNQDGSMKVVPIKNQFVELERACKPGSVFSPDACNTCICNSDGTKIACTRKLCISNLNNAYGLENSDEWGPVYHQGDKCTPGKLFYSECNKCVCGDNGNSAYCTYMQCHSKFH